MAVHQSIDSTISSPHFSLHQWLEATFFYLVHANVKTCFGWKLTSNTPMHGAGQEKMAVM
jgi:hypothetical protein